jgi:Smg protein
MFDVLVFVYEHYWEANACPELPLLGRRLSAAGFEGDEIEQALAWLEGLDAASKSADLIDIAPKKFTKALNPVAGLLAATDQIAQPLCVEPSQTSLRIYSEYELSRLGAACLSFLSFLEKAGAMSCALREIILDRALASPVAQIELDDFKIIVLMVYWSFGIEPDALILDELCDDEDDRVSH